MADQNNQIEPMLTTSEVAKILNVHINTVRRWSNQGAIKSYRIGSRGDRRFRKGDVDALFSSEGALNLNKEAAEQQ